VAETAQLSDEFIRQLSAVGEVDVLVGIPTFNNKDTIERVVRAVQIGLTKYFHRDRCVLINPDGGSTDGTPEIFKNASVSDFEIMLTSNPLRTFHRVSAPYHGIPGKETALRTLFVAADLLRAKACAILSPTSLSVTPEWVESLVRPVYRENFDFVAPLYQRQKFDGLLVKGLLSPLIRAAYGARVREPVASDLGLSGKLARHFLDKDIWDQDMTTFGLEIWMTTTAIVDGFKMSESFLGPRIQPAPQFGQDLPGTIRQVVGALFKCLEMQESYWLQRTGSEALPTFGFQYDVALEPLKLNLKNILDNFRSNIDQLVPVLESILAPATLADVQKMIALPDRQFRCSDELWVKVVCEFAAAYHHSAINRDHLLQALAPLYRARVSSFILENAKAPAAKLDQRFEELGQVFETQKPYLIDRWSAKAGGDR